MASEPSDLFGPIRNIQLRVDGLEQTLKKGGGDGTFDGMEARVNRLEERLDKLIDRTGAVEVSVATLTERVSHLPSKSYIDARLLAMLAVIAALITFGDKIQAFVS